MKRLAAVLQSEAGSALPLLAAAVLALLLANSPLAWMADRLLGTKLTVAFGTLGLSKPLMLWINDGLMAIFFLVGLENQARAAGRRALLVVAQAALPVIAAVGGMVAPAMVYVAVTAADPPTLRAGPYPPRRISPSPSAFSR